MADYAILNNNLVSNIIVADTKEIALEVSPLGTTVVESTNDNPAGVGWIYDGSRFIDPRMETPNA